MRRFTLSLLITALSSYMFGQNLEWVLNAHYPEGYPFSEFEFPNSGVVSIAVDGNGNTYAVGNYFQSLYFNEEQHYTSNGGPMFILKADNTGEIIWIKEIRTGTQGISGHANPFEIQVNSQSEIVVIGEFNGWVDFDPSDNNSAGSELYAFGIYNNFILKLSTDGEFQWVKQIMTGGSNVGFNIWDIIIEDDNDIIITGYYDMYLMLNSVIVLNPPTGNIGFPDHIYLMKLDNAGTLSWVKTIVPNSEYFATRLTKNSEGNTVVFISRNTATAADETLYPYLAAEDNGISTVYRAVRFDENGDYLEHTTLFSVPYSLPYSYYEISSIMNDLNGNYILNGKLNGSIDFDLSDNVFSLSSETENDCMVVLKVSESGEFGWAKKFDAETISFYSLPYLHSLATNQEGDVYLLGTVSGTIDFNPDSGVANYTSIGENPNIFLLNLSASGGLLSVKFLGDNTSTFSGGIATDSEGNIFYGGRYYQQLDFTSFGANIVIESNNPGNYGNAVICKFYQDECSQLFPFIISSTALNCANVDGYAEVETSGGTPPYQYVWNTTPLIEENSITVDSTGIYTVSVTDAEGCQRSLGVYIHGPDIASSYDLRSDIYVFPGSSFVPGQSATIRAMASNSICLSVDGLLKFILDPLTTFAQASVAPVSIAGDTLFFQTGNLQFGDSPFIVDIQVVTDTIALAGDEICFSTQVSPIDNDYNLTNNNKVHCRFVQTSYDPNLKSVYPVGECEEHYVELDQKLTYTVQFQNTGTFAAINIAVMDTLSSLLDINTLRVIHSSHDMITEVYDDHILKFKFPNIYLADSASNETESHGYIIFEIEPKSTIASGSVVENKVAIYFDYNEPVITNTVFNTFVNSIPECVVSVNEIVSNDGNLLLYPNPADDMLNVVIKNYNSNGIQIRITDITGKVVEQQTHNASGSLILNTSELASGVYLLSVMNGNTVQSVRFVKQ